MTPRSRPYWRLAKWLAGAVVAAVTAGALVLGGLYLYVAPGLPEVDQLREVELQEPLRVYTADAELLAVYGTKRRVPLAFADIPERVRSAFVAAEDDRFYAHPGVDWMGIVRAAWNLLLTGDKGQGGSTITMQVARNFFLTREKTYLRKVNEIFLALKIERELDKAKILELYLNKIYLGERAHGVGAAAQAYYGKSVDELTLPQMAMIAGLPKAPSRYNPVRNPERAKQRRNYVLGRMLANGYIERDAFEAARAAPVTARSHRAPVDVDAPYVGEMARLEVVQRFGEDAYTSGYRVYTTAVADEQRAATRALRQALLAYERRHGYKGPIARLDPRRLPAPEALRAALAGDGAVEPEGEGILGPAELDTALGGYREIGPLRPVVVVGVDGDGATVYGRNAGLAALPWAALEWAAPRLDGGGKGEAPEEPADVLARGDVVYVVDGGKAAQVRLAQEPGVEGALVALDPHDGGIRALVGGFSFERSKFNRAVQARRQPGSAFKPFIYSAALGKDFTAATLINDAPVVFDDPALEDIWRPENYSGRVFGPTRLREGLVHSRNLVSIRVLLSIGIPYAIDYIQRFGFPEAQLPHDLTLALGSAALSPLQLARGYAAFANMGFRLEPYLVTRIATGDGRVVYRANPATVCPQPCEADHDGDRPHAAPAGPDDDGDPASGEPVDIDERHLDDQERPDELAAVGVPDRDRAREPRFAERVIEQRNAYIVRSFLRDVARRGTGRRTRALGRDDIAGKTGTTDDQLDAWFSGFNSSVVATAWVGYDELETLGRRETGARAALPMWMDFMRTALADVPEGWPDLPPGMVTVRIDPETGEYAGARGDDAVFEIFRKERAPQQPAPGQGDGGNGGSGNDGVEPLF